MWIASKHGFYSIVLKEGGLHVRARKRGDMVNLCAAARIPFNKIIPTPYGDYTHRLILRSARDRRELWSAVWKALAESIDYPNFKAQINSTPHQRRKLPIYANFWAEMASMAFQGRPKKAKKDVGYVKQK